MTRPYIFICVAFFLAACGGGGQPVVESFTESFTTAKIFGDRDQDILILVFFEINLLKVKKSFSFNAIHPAVGLQFLVK